MPRPAKSNSAPRDSTANLGFEAKLWLAADKATTMGHIQRGRFTAAKVLIPPRPLLDAMIRTMSPLIDQVIANHIQSRTLATLRDTLLPKLLSGELAVGAASVGSKVSMPSQKAGLDRMDPMDGMDGMDKN